MALMPQEEEPYHEEQEEEVTSGDPANDIFKHTFVDVLDKKPSEEEK
jgi:hypothetical protein